MNDLDKIHSFLTKSIDKAFQSRNRLYKKCIKKGFEKDNVNKELDYFEKLGLINDLELAKSIANTLHFNNGLVGYPLFQKLLLRDLPAEIVEKVVSDIADLNDEEEIAKEQIFNFSLDDDLQKQKAYRKLKSKGFSDTVIDNVIN